MSRFSNTADSGGVTGSTVGPLRWMSPESLSDGIYNEKTDIYSFGILVWETMTNGSRPYPTINDPVQVASKVVMGQLKLEIPLTAPSILADIMRSCMKFKADERPTFKDIIALFPLK